MAGDLEERVRVFRWQRQRMAGAMAGKSADQVLAAAGWIRSVGGATPYLTFRDRAGLSRAAVDAQVAKGELCELPSARGCTYVVPKQDFALALRAGQGRSEESEIALAKKHLGVTDKEIDKLCKAVIDALDKGELDPAAMKEALGGAVRSLGEAGKKRGMSSTLPLALGRLQAQGQIRRVPVEGRLDRQRFRYARWRPSPLDKFELTQADLELALARKFFGWAAPARVDQFAWWAGLGLKAARAAAAELSLRPLAEGDARLIAAEELDELKAVRAPKEPAYSFVGLLDNLIHLRRDPTAALGEGDEELDLSLGVAKKAGGSLLDLAVHPIVDRGRIVGLWDYDGAAQKLIYKSLRKEPKGMAEAARAAERFVQQELEDVRAMSLDSPESREPRLQALRKASWR